MRVEKEKGGTQKIFFFFIKFQREKGVVDRRTVRFKLCHLLLRIFTLLI